MNQPRRTTTGTTTLARTALTVLALLAPVAVQANTLWQVSITYPDRIQRLAPYTPNPDHYFFFAILPTLRNWYTQGLILGFGENECTGTCVASVTWTHSPVEPNIDPIPIPEPAQDPQTPTPEPTTFLMLGTALMAACACLRRVWCTHE